MIIVIHKNNKVKEVIGSNFKADNGNIVHTIINLSKLHPNEVIGWCDHQLKECANFNCWESLLGSKMDILTFNPSAREFMPDLLGYVDNTSPFLNINKSVRYGTHILSSAMGCATGEVIQLFEKYESIKKFDLFLQIVGMVGMKAGLLPYSEPRLIIKNIDCNYCNSYKMTDKEFFDFVKTFYTRNLFIYALIILFLAERKIRILPFVISIIYNNLKLYNIDIKQLYDKERSITDINDEDSYDVIIPTLGRSQCLKNVLIDLNNQTHKPKNVIIVEQNYIEGAKTELEYLYNESWDFNIKHKLIYQLGACNARNMAIDMIDKESKYVFFADDDIRIESNTISSAISYIKNLKTGAVTIVVYQKNEVVDINVIPTYWQTFGSGCSIVKTEFVTYTKFSMECEFGYGEDVDYGCKLRNKGCSISIFNEKPMLHLKAPIGGFRFKYKHPWSDDKIQPKPSPTVAFNWVSNYNNKQLESIKWLMWIKMYKIGENPFRHIKMMKKRWDRSMYWVEWLKDKYAKS